MAASARDIAVSALRDRAGNVTAHLDRLLARHAPGGADAALARELALGAVRRRATLEAVLRAFLARPGSPLAPGLREILHVALYQILFLDRVPDFAAVDEAVSQARRPKRPRHAGLVNAVLRQALRDLGKTEAGPPPCAADVLPVAPNAFRRVAREVLPDPEADAAGYLASAYSLPEVLAKRWLGRFGSLAGAIAPARHACCRAPLVVRVNAFRADVRSVLASLGGRAIAAVPHANGRSVVLSRAGDVTRLDEFREGLLQPQDATATAVGAAAGVAPGMRVLDFCAAPGTKTTHLAELMENRGEIVAVDVSPDKLGRIEDSCRRMGASIVRTMPAERVGSLAARSFDVVLADVPCSNTGVLARRAEARWRFSEKAIARAVRQQRSLVTAAAGFVADGGRLAYSTCSLEPEENEQIAGWLAASDGHLGLVRDKLTLPGGEEDPAEWHDGGYLAIFRRS